MRRPVIVQVRAVAVVQDRPLGLAVAVKAIIGLPPSETGAAQVIVAR